MARLYPRNHQRNSSISDLPWRVGYWRVDLTLHLSKKPNLVLFLSDSNWSVLCFISKVHHGRPFAFLPDNEYSQSPPSHAEYFVDLKTAFYNSSIVVPLTANDAGAKRNWINGTVRVISFREFHLTLIFRVPSIFTGICKSLAEGHLLTICSYAKYRCLPARV